MAGQICFVTSLQKAETCVALLGQMLPTCPTKLAPCDQYAVQPVRLNSREPRLRQRLVCKCLSRRSTSSTQRQRTCVFACERMLLYLQTRLRAQACEHALAHVRMRMRAFWYASVVCV
eukprot:6196758-Pleurochrysis_carterae.AAC.2